MGFAHRQHPSLARNKRQSNTQLPTIDFHCYRCSARIDANLTTAKRPGHIARHSVFFLSVPSHSFKNRISSPKVTVHTCQSPHSFYTATAFTHNVHYHTAVATGAQSHTHRFNVFFFRPNHHFRRSAASLSGRLLLRRPPSQYPPPSKTPTTFIPPRFAAPVHSMRATA